MRREGRLVESDHRTLDQRTHDFRDRDRCPADPASVAYPTGTTVHSERGGAFRSRHHKPNSTSGARRVHEQGRPCQRKRGSSSFLALLRKNVLNGPAEPPQTNSHVDHDLDRTGLPPPSPTMFSR